MNHKSTLRYQAEAFIKAAVEAEREACAVLVQAYKYHERGEGIEDELPHVDANPDYIQYAIDEVLQAAAVAIRTRREEG